MPMCLRSSKSKLNLQEVGDHESLSFLELGCQAQVRDSVVGEAVSSQQSASGLEDGIHPVRTGGT